MAALSFAGAKRDEGTLRLKAGKHKVKILEVKGTVPTENKKDASGKETGELKAPFIEMKFGNEDGIFVKKFYFSEKAAEGAMTDIIHVANKIISEDEINKIEADNVVELAKKLDKKISNKKEIYILIYDKLQDNGKVYPEVPYKPFAGAVDGDKDRLEYDPSKNDKPKEKPANAMGSASQPTSGGAAAKFDWPEDE